MNVPEIHPETVQRAAAQAQSRLATREKYFQDLLASGQTTEQVEKARRKLDRLTRKEDFSSYVGKVCRWLDKARTPYQVWVVADCVLQAWPVCPSPKEMATEHIPGYLLWAGGFPLPG
jgi:hypothetical protein